MATIPQPTPNIIPGIPLGAGDPAAAGYSSMGPLLVPDFYTPSTLNGSQGQVALLSPNDLLGQPGYQRVNATVLATIAGAVANGNQLRLTFTNTALNNIGGTRVINITAVTGDSVDDLAERFIDAIAADPVLNSLGVFGTALPTGALTINWPGPVGNFTTVSRTIVSGSETITFTPGTGIMAGGAGSVWPFNNFAYTFGGQSFWFKARTPTVVPAPVLAAMVRDAMPIS